MKPEEKLKEASKLFESITCLRVEEVEFFSAHEILDSICREAVKGYNLCKGEYLDGMPET